MTVRSRTLMLIGALSMLAACVAGTQLPASEAAADPLAAPAASEWLSDGRD